MEVQRRCNGDATEMQWRCNGGGWQFEPAREWAKSPRWRSRESDHLCSLKVSHPMGGFFPFQVVIAPYRLWCLGRAGRSQVLNVNDKFMRMNTTMYP